ncbi:MAG: hypothetical protein LOY00_15405, partial [Methylocaldum sp.]|nr:hypothetical protein [Methylocaldum sp.]
MQRLGRLEPNSEGKRILKTRLDGLAMSGFTLDLIAVTREKRNPEEGGVLFGTPGFMQRLYYGDKPWTVTRVGSWPNLPRQDTGFAAKPFEFMLPKLAHADAKKRNDLDA